MDDVWETFGSHYAKMAKNLAHYQSIGCIWNTDIECLLQLCNFSLSQGWEMVKGISFLKNISIDAFCNHYNTYMSEYYVLNIVDAKKIAMIEKTAEGELGDEIDDTEAKALNLSKTEDARRFLIQLNPFQYLQKMWFANMYWHYLEESFELIQNSGKSIDLHADILTNPFVRFITDIHPIIEKWHTGKAWAYLEVAYYGQLAMTAKTICEKYKESDLKEEVFKIIDSLDSITRKNLVSTWTPIGFGIDFVTKLRSATETSFPDKAPLKVTNEVIKRLIQGTYKELKLGGRKADFWPAIRINVS